MTKRPLAALCALLAFMAVLVAVPLATAETADAHPKTVQRCAYDPFAGRQCWNETSYNHAHTPVQRNICPAGTTGTPPNCQAPKCPVGYSGTPPNCVKIEVCPSGTTGTPPNCVPDVCPTGTTGTPPNCRTVQPPPDCSPVVRGRGVRPQHKHTLGTGSAATTSACHPVRDSHCPLGQHEHVHGSRQCHVLGQKADNSDGDHKGWTDHCPAGEHSHDHDGDCHLEKQQGWRFPEACRGPDAGVRYHNHGQGLACHPVGADLCPVGQHEHKPGIYFRVRGCHDEDTQHGSGELKQSEGYLYDAAGVIVCYGAGVGGAAAAAKLILKGISWLGAAIAGAPGGIGAGQGCEALFDWLEEAERNKREQEKKDHDSSGGSDPDDDGGEGTDGDSGSGSGGGEDTRPFCTWQQYASGNTEDCQI